MHTQLELKFPTLKHLCMYDVSSRLRAKGYQMIGDGGYGRVYALPNSNYVIKVGTEEDGWLNYAKLAMMHPNPCLPKIYRIFESDFCYIVQMEKLYSHEYSEGRYYYNVRDLALHLLYKNQRSVSDTISRHTIRAVVRELPRDITVSVAKSIKPVREWLSMDFELDLHMGNIMVREDGFPVITDPLAERVWRYA